MCETDRRVPEIEAEPLIGGGLGNWACAGADWLNTEVPLSLGDCKLPKDGDNSDGGFSGVGAVVAGIPAFWLGCGTLGTAKTESGTGNWLAGLFEDPEMVRALSTENGDAG